MVYLLAILYLSVLAGFTRGLFILQSNKYGDNFKTGDKVAAVIMGVLWPLIFTVLGFLGIFKSESSIYNFLKGGK